jgi:uncharacterized membrane protein YfcA
MVLLGLAATLGAGVALGLLGGGGSLLVVPTLVYLFGRPPVEATAYSLLVVGAVSLAGVYLHRRRRPIPFRRIASFGAASVTAAYVVRGMVVPRLPAVLAVGGLAVARDVLIMLTFASFAAAAGLAMVRPGTSTPRQRTAPAWGLLAGALTGALAAFVGAGGGFLVLPALILLIGLDIEEAVGASLAVVAAQSIAGAVGAWAAMPTWDFRLALTLALTMLVGVAGGVRIAHRVSPSRLKHAFGWLMLAVAAATTLQELW